MVVKENFFSSFSYQRQWLLKVNEEHMKCKIGEHVGSAGHVLLTFKSGGHLLTSMGHWVELMKVDTSEKKLFEIA